MYRPSAPQLRALGWIYVAYIMCYLLRKNFPIMLPSLAAASLLTHAQAGVVSSVFEVCIGAVKFFCGVFVDRSPSPGLLLAKCLGVAGVACLLMQLVFWTLTGEALAPARVALVSVLWSANGAGQAVAWPALARVFLAWFPDVATRGTWYSILATNQNLGGTLSPIVYPPLIKAYGWEAALGWPAVLVICFAVLMGLSLRSKPPAGSELSQTLQSGEVIQGKREDGEQQAKSKPGFVETFVHLLSMRSFVLLSLAYIPIMVIRQSLINWTAVIFEDAGMSLFQAGTCISALEFGGFIGGLTAGYISDAMFSGRRGPVMATFSLLCVPLSLMLPYALEQSTMGDAAYKMLILRVVFFSTGFASFPPHSLIGLMSREITPEAMRSTAGCLAKATGQFGAAAAGWPLQALCATHGWANIGYVNAVAGVVAAAAFSPLWNTVGKVSKARTS